ncbi:hypothetical protein GPAL_1727 [Glaciecola pallidula DSM 14239 = ACAM 615]|uniref:Uncharacterized protein n=1 Tax=Brumicola pallidula DSM 14239 = ACAM 615 TaxID=1121922 RepID=K6ZZ76_9ALTE|nr:hypothetical protein GPAL_1727 [Glaciecola pallidula DSM 14239 = ACAM 615]
MLWRTLFDHQISVEQYGNSVYSSERSVGLTSIFWPQMRLSAK